MLTQTQYNEIIQNINKFVTDRITGNFINRVNNLLYPFDCDLFNEANSVDLVPTDNENHFHLVFNDTRKFGSPRKYDHMLAVEIHNPKNPYITINRNPQNITCNFPYVLNDRLKISAWVISSRACFTSETKFINLISRFKKTVSHETLLEAIKNNSKSLPKFLLNLLKDEETVSKFCATVINDLTEADVSFINSVIKEKSILYFRVHHTVIEQILYLSVHFVLINETTFAFNKITDHCINLPPRIANAPLP